MCEVSLANTTSTTQPSMRPLQLSTESLETRGDASLLGWGFSFFWNHVYIHVLQDKHGSFKMIYRSLTLRSG